MSQFVEVGGLQNISRWELIRSKQRDSDGANIMSETYVGLVLAVDMDDQSKYILYGYFKNYKNSGSSPAETAVLASNGLTLGNRNSVGTQVVNGGTNVQQFMIGFGG